MKKVLVVSLAVIAILLGCLQPTGNNENSDNLAKMEEVQKITASDGAADDWFGVSVAIDGDKAIVGTYQGDGNESDSGAVYFFHRESSGWVEKQKVVASDGAELDEFGMAVFQVGARYFFEIDLYDAFERGEYLDGETIAKYWVKNRDKIYGDAIEWLPEM